MTGRAIVLNGPSSAGKSTLARTLQGVLPEPFLVLGLDQFLFGEVLPRDADGRVREWSSVRPRLVAGYFRAVGGFLDAGNDLIVDLVLEDSAQRDQLERALAGRTVLRVGVHVDLDELERREVARGDRSIGDARRDVLVVHAFMSYDLEIDGSLPSAVLTEQVARAWTRRLASPAPPRESRGRGGRAG